MLVVDVSNPLVALVINDVVIMEVRLVVGKELLTVAVVCCVFVVSKGVFSEVEVTIEVGDMVVWALAVVRIVFCVVPVIGKIGVERIVSVVGTEEEGLGMVVVIFSAVVVVGEVFMAEVTLSVVVGG